MLLSMQLQFGEHIYALILSHYILLQRLQSMEQIIPKKDRGHLIHDSDYIQPENWRLIMKGPNGEVLKEAQQIIYPGSNGDSWWDPKQLIDQVVKR